MHKVIASSKSALLISEIKIPNSLRDEVEVYSFLEQPEIIVMGRRCQQTRDIAVFCDHTEKITYAGIEVETQPTSKALRKLFRRVKKLTGISFNTVLVNRYLDGRYNISAHSDNEVFLGDGRVEGYEGKIVACVSLGATRKLRIRNKETREIVQDISLKDGEMYLMVGKFQQEYTHEIPAQPRVSEVRYSFTFRNY